MEQQFSLTWKNFHGNLSVGFSELLSSGQFVDVTLACEGQLLQAHKVVLSICSPYFKRMFQLNPCQHPIVVLRDISHRAMKDLIHFMYNGEVNVRQEDLASFINTAETLQIKGLTNKHTDEETTEEVPVKVPSPPPPIVNTSVLELNPDSTNHFTEDLAQRLENTQNQIDLINSLRMAALKRKSEEFLANNFNMPLSEKSQQLPEKRIKLREKHILNRHKITNNFSNRPASTENFEPVQARNENIPAPINNFNDFVVNNLAKAERSNPLNDIKATQDANMRNSTFNSEEIKVEKAEECDISFDEPVLHKTNGLEGDGSMDMTLSRLEQEDGVQITVETPPTILRASWPISQQNRKSSSPGNTTVSAHNGIPLSAKASPPKTVPVSNHLASPGQILSNVQSSLVHIPVLTTGQSHHTIVTIPQKEDGKKKYPQRSCRFCWRKAGKRRDTRFMCQECCVPLCKTSCFELHQSEGFLLNFKDDSTTAVL